MQTEQIPQLTLSHIQVRPVERHEEPQYKALMVSHHYLGDWPKIGETICYIATQAEQWVALISIPTAALKCGVRDRLI